jgi:hypothetical protein
MAKIIEFNLGGFKKPKKDQKEDKNLEEKTKGGMVVNLPLDDYEEEDDFFPSGPLMSEENFKAFAEKMVALHMPLKDKAEILKKVKELAEAEELQGIAINKSLYLENLQNLQKHDISKLVEIFKNNSVMYFKNDVPFTKAVIDSLLASEK